MALLSPVYNSERYFHRLVSINGSMTAVKSPGGSTQYQQRGVAYAVNETIMMLPSDVSLLQDPAYNALVLKFASNLTYLSEVFSAAWCVLCTITVLVVGTTPSQAPTVLVLAGEW